jgi:hypothetical protein
MWMRSSPSSSSSKTMPALHMVCNNAADDGPLGAQYREVHEAEPQQRRSGCPTGYILLVRCEGRSRRRKTTTEKLLVEDEPDAGRTPAPSPATTSMVTSSRSKQKREAPWIAPAPALEEEAHEQLRFPPPPRPVGKTENTRTPSSSPPPSPPRAAEKFRQLPTTNARAGS